MADSRSSAVLALSAAGAAAAALDLLSAAKFRPTGATVTELCRYPIKSLSRETLSEVAVEAEGTIPGDREWAILRGTHVHEHDPSASRWLHKAKFHVAMVRDLPPSSAVRPGRPLSVCAVRAAG